MVQAAVTDLAAYFDDEITAMPNLVTTAATTVGALNSGSITSGFGAINNGSSAISTSGTITYGTLNDGSNNLTSTAAELNYLDGSVLGTPTASKAVVADGNQNIGIVRATALHIGNSGSETQVTSTAVEINKLDGVNSSTSEIDQRIITVSIADVSSTGQVYVVAPFDGTLTTVYGVLNGQIATGDATLTVKNGSGSSAGTITVTQAGSAAGDKFTLSPSTNNTFTVGQLIEIETDGASTNSVQLDLTLVFTIT